MKQKPGHKIIPDNSKILTLGLPNVQIIGKLERFQTARTPQLTALVRRLKDHNVHTLTSIANLVFQRTPIEEEATIKGTKLGRHAQDILSRGAVDVLHCYDRCHALLGLLNAKKIPSWLVLEIDWRNFAHTYVEAMVGKKLYTVAFRSYERPIITPGRVEEALDVQPTSHFLRGADLGNLGVTNRDELKRLIEQINAGKASGVNKIHIK